jgi:hypothetical protein
VNRAESLGCRWRINHIKKALPGTVLGKNETRTKSLTFSEFGRKINGFSLP